IVTLPVLGSSSVGETKLFHCLATLRLQIDDELVRLCAFACTEALSVSRLVGAPPASAAYVADRYLPATARRRPYSVLLLDQAAKAPPNVFNILFRLLDDGRLPAGQGTAVGFATPVRSMTSNPVPDLPPVRFDQLV
ncbi:AAA family ATPase, partial [Salmonella enterica]|uniref:AAA family ATPase n=1 Tax=Salmonella enterica TaxID=28901 RepID=UPI00398C474D